LEFALEEINAKRFKGKLKSELDAMRDSGDEKYYEVPLALGSSDSLAT